MGFKTARAGNNRNLIVQGQTLLSDVNKMLMTDPLLWTILDAHPLACDPTLQDRRTSPEFKAKLQAFVDIVANMFDMMLAELPDPRAEEITATPDADSWSASGVWLRFFESMLDQSSSLRNQLERSESRLLFQPAIKNAYAAWRKRPRQS